MERSYWSRILDKRLTRRRTIASTGAASAGAALLAACGGGSGSKEKGDVSGLIAKVVDETKSAKRGGTLKSRSSTEPATFEPQTFLNSAGLANYCYSTLWEMKEGVLDREPGEVVGDLVESWEVSPDRLTITAKINPNAHFAPQPPTNGRAVDAKDVEISWNRMKQVSSRRAEFANEISPSAPIVSITAPDERTVVIKTKEPTATLLSLLAWHASGTMIVVPKEGQDTNLLDLRTTVRGSGPWYLAEYERGAYFTLKRNPGYKQEKAEFPYIDQVDFPLVVDYATAMAQFRTGAFWTTFAAKATDILPLKREVPDLDLMQTEMLVTNVRTLFGNKPDSPFKDERVRQAWVLTWDRDLFLESYYNIKEYQQSGLQVESALEAAIPALSWKGWYIDPLSKEFGAASKNFKYDVAEAKKLMAAAGHPNGLTVDLNVPANDPQLTNAATFIPIIESLIGMVSDSGLFKLNRKEHRLVAEFAPRIRDSKGQFDGAAMNQSGNTAPDPIQTIYAQYHPDSGIVQHTDATMADLINRSMREFDTTKRRELVHEIQRYEGGKMFAPRLGSSSGFEVSWPIVRNKMVYRSFGNANRTLRTLFIDPDKPPRRA